MSTGGHSSLYYHRHTWQSVIGLSWHKQVVYPLGSYKAVVVYDPARCTVLLTPLWESSYGERAICCETDLSLQVCPIECHPLDAKAYVRQAHFHSSCEHIFDRPARCNIHASALGDAGSLIMSLQKHCGCASFCPVSFGVCDRIKIRKMCATIASLNMSETCCRSWYFADRSSARCRSQHPATSHR